MLKKIISLILLLCFSTSVCFAEESLVLTLKQGEAAPFDGTLLNQQASTDMILKLQNCEENCSLRLEKERKIQKANCDLAVDKLKIANDFEIKVYKSQNDFLKSQIDISIKQLEKKNVRTEWYFVGGFVAGTLTAILITYAIHSVTE